jgi:hypothetical protein
MIRRLMASFAIAAMMAGALALSSGQALANVVWGT